VAFVGLSGVASLEQIAGSAAESSRWRDPEIDGR
jgi:hypothetical protein